MRALVNVKMPWIIELATNDQFALWLMQGLFKQANLQEFL